jgi:hypothetical protein
MSSYKLRDADVIFLRNLLRRGSVRWPGRAEALQDARKKVLIRRSKTGKPIYKYHWQCAVCKRWHKDVAEMEVDHIVEIGPFKGDWNEFLFRHFPPDRAKMQVLCIPCHMKKTKAFNSARSLYTRKK